MPHISPREIRLFQTKILSWYEKHKRDLPWRKTRDPYKILVSEVMLQQTQVSRVIPKYEEWLRTFPTTAELAKASVSDVLRVWMGLGYNRRALYLKKTAEAVEKNGFWPKEEKELLSLPGIGKYTARALLCFAFGKEVTVVDTNIRKVLTHEFFHGELPTETEIERLAEELLPVQKAYDWNQALMDYAGAVLKDKKIPVPKQSKYVGSDRYYRAKLLKLLLEKKQIKEEQLGLMLRDDYTQVLQPWLEAILLKMEKEDLIKRTDQTVWITR